MQVYILAFIIALLASWVLTPYVKKLAFRIGALDKPDGRKVHHGIMPRLGGLAIYLAFVIAVFATMHITRDIMALLLGGTLIVIVGILDDKYQLPAKVKLLGQIAAAFVLVLRDTTERPEAVTAGTVKLIGTAYEDVLRETNLLLDNPEHYRAMAEAVNPYGDGEACARIVSRILREFGFEVKDLPEFTAI